MCLCVSARECTTVCITAFVEEIDFLSSSVTRGQHAKQQGCRDSCVCERVCTQMSWRLPPYSVCVCACAVVSLPVCVQGCMRVCGCIDPFLAAAV